jgi:SPX domain protein involved in polyphosphate accumulation
MIEGYTPLEDYRYERKYTTAMYNSGKVGLLVRQNPALFRQSYAARQVNNIYFDTPGLDCYFDNLFGVGKRWKARIRWYGDLRQSIKQPVLELKIKHGYLNTKQSWKLKPIDLTKKNNGWRFLRENILESGLPDNVKNRLLCMQPVMLNSYQRDYYVSMDNKLRLTVDTKLEYRDFRYFVNSSNQVFKESDKIVIELKYPREFDERARGISNLFPFRLDKNSKFVSGMEFIRKGVAE